jgi:hypothetical protein
MALDVMALPWEVAEKRLQEAKISYETEISRPTRDFFPVDEHRLYVVRQCLQADGKLLLTLAAKQLPVKEV